MAGGGSQPTRPGELEKKVLRSSTNARPGCNRYNGTTMLEKTLGPHDSISPLHLHVIPPIHPRLNLYPTALPPPSLADLRGLVSA
jgi:hypothetical protein